jgi:hypothetical protein
MTNPEPTPISTIGRAPAATARARWTLLAAALGFVAFFVATGLVASGLASSALPLPDDPVQQVREWYAHNQLAAVTIGLSQFLSVVCLGAFALLLPRAARTDAQVTATRRACAWGLAAMTLMMLSSVLGWVLAAVAATASLDTVSALRTANFVAGGTAHVAVLGVFVWLASRSPGFGKPLRWLAVVALVVSLLSLSSLLWFYGSAFILLGRVLCMLWTVCGAVSLLRGSATIAPGVTAPKEPMVD